MATPYVTPADVLERLRLELDDPDAEYVGRCTDAANELVDAYYDDNLVPLVAPFPASVWRAALGAAIRIYRYKDVESDTGDTVALWPTVGSMRIPRDPLAGYVDELKLYRDGAGWAPA